MSTVRPILLSEAETAFLLGVLHSLLARPTIPGTGDRFGREVIGGLANKLSELAVVFYNEESPP